MINLDRNKLKELLSTTFDEGCCGYKEFKDGFIEQILTEAETASIKFNEAKEKSKAAPNQGNYTVTVDARNNYSSAMLRDLYGIGAGGGGTSGYGATGRYGATGGTGPYVSGTGNWGGTGSTEGWTVAAGAAGSNGQIYINYN